MSSLIYFAGGALTGICLSLWAFTRLIDMDADRPTGSDHDPDCDWPETYPHPCKCVTKED